MVKHFYFLLLLSPILSFAQSDLKYEVGTFGLVSPNAEIMPHWLIFNRNGIFSGNTNEFLTYLDLEYTNSFGKRWKIEAGLQGVNKFPVSNSFLQEAYFNLSYGKLKLRVGKEEMGYIDYNSRLTSGSFLFSQNARPVPRLGIGFYDYVDVPYTKGYVQIKGFMNQGILDDDRSPNGTDKPLLHEKSAYIRTNKLLFNPHFGVSHSALFGGTMPDGQKIPVDFISTIFGKSSQKVGEVFHGEGTNAAGGHLGLFDFGINFQVNDMEAQIYYQKPVNDASGFIGIFRRNKDVISGISIKNINSSLLKEFLYEHVYTGWQSGPGIPDPYINGNYYLTMEDKTNYDKILKDNYGIEVEDISDRDFWRLIRRMENYGYEYGGRDNYYNNGMYYKGWSYHDNAIGNSFLLTEQRVSNINPDFDSSYDYFFVNTRVNAHHFGILGKVSQNLDYRLLLSFVENLGTYYGLNRGYWDSMDPLSDYDYYFSDYHNDKGKDQFYTMLETVYSFPNIPQLKLNMSLGIDTKRLYNNYGLLVGLTYSGFITKKSTDPAN